MTFARSLGFAALAGAGVPLFVGGLGPLLGHAFALELYIVSAGAGYLAVMAGNPRRAVVAAACAGAIGMLLLLLPLRLPALVAGTALMIAVGRSTFLHRSGSLRAVTLELLLQGGGLLLARYLAGSDAISLALATWGYFLVQSLYFLVGGIALRRPAPVGDPFDQARTRLLALLE